MISYDGQKPVVSLLVIHLADPTPYESDKVVPYKYNDTMVEGGKDMHIPTLLSVVNIVYVSGVTRSGRVFTAAAPNRTEDVVIEKSTQAKTLVMQTGQSSSVNPSFDQDEVLRLIKKSDFNMVD